MAEYGREQRNQLSRAVANSETGSKQLKGFVDNRRITNKPIQYKKNMLECTTEIKVFGKQARIEGTGKNNPNDRETVLSNIRNHKETAWIADVPKQNGGNKPGACAEPHSLSDALSKIGEDDKIEDVTQSEAKFVLTPSSNIKNANPTLGVGSKYPPCETCKKWLSDLHKISESWSDYADVAD